MSEPKGGSTEPPKAPLDPPQSSGFANLRWLASTCESVWLDWGLGYNRLNWFPVHADQSLHFGRQTHEIHEISIEKSESFQDVQDKVAHAVQEEERNDSRCVRRGGPNIPKRCRGRWAQNIEFYFGAPRCNKFISCLFVYFLALKGFMGGHGPSHRGKTCS